MLSSRYLYLHEALDLGPMWLKQTARVCPSDTPPAQPSSATAAPSTAQAITNTPAVTDAPAPQPVHQHIQQILQHLTTAHTQTPTSATPPTIEKQLPAPPTNSTADTTDLQTLPTVLAACTACALHGERRQPLAGHGTVQAKLMVISPNPAPADDDAHQLFSGDVGRLLRNMLAAIGVDEQEVFYTSQVKCTPNVSLHIHDEHISACRPYLQQQLAVVQPQAVLLLGQAFARMPAETLQAHLHHLPYVILPHPARLLRQSHLKAQAWAALQQLAAHLHHHKR